MPGHATTFPFFIRSLSAVSISALFTSFAASLLSSTFCATPPCPSCSLHTARIWVVTDGGLRFLLAADAMAWQPYGVAALWPCGVAALWRGKASWVLQIGSGRRTVRKREQADGPGRRGGQAADATTAQSFAECPPA